jgi:hypothetical protein
VYVTKQFLLLNGFQEDEIWCLVDDGSHDMPTGENIMKGMKWLVQDSTPESSLYMHFSGHGVQIKDKDNEETDGKDECIAPFDVNENGVITDDQLLKTLILPMAPEAHCILVFDCCHSGTIVDLPWYWTGRRTRHLDPNPEWSFAHFVRIGKDFVEDVSDTISGGLKNMVDFVKSIAGVAPVI